MNIEDLGTLYNKVLNEYGYSIKLGNSYKDTRVYNQDGSKLYSTTIKGVTNCGPGLVFCGDSPEMVFFDSDYSLGVSVSGDVNLKVQHNMKYAHATYLSIDDYNILTNNNNQIIIKVDDDELSIIVCIIRKVNGKYLKPITMNIDQGKINARVYEGGNSYTVPSGTDSYLNEIYVFLENNLKDVVYNGNMVNEVLESLRPALKLLLDNLIKIWFSKLDTYIEMNKINKENARIRYQNVIEKCDHELEIAHHDNASNIDELREKKTNIINQYNLIVNKCNNALEWLYQIKTDGIETLLSGDTKQNKRP